MRHYLLLLMILVGIPGACSSGGGGGAATLKASDLEGSWLARLTTTGLEGASCDPISAIGNIGVGFLTVALVGDSVTLVLETGTVFDLDLVGSSATASNMDVSVDASGVTTTTETTLEISLVGSQLAGTVVTEQFRGDGNAVVTLCYRERAIVADKQLVPPADFGGAWNLTSLVLSSSCGVAPGFVDVGEVLLNQDGGRVEVVGVGSLLSTDDNGGLFGTVTGRVLTLYRPDGLTVVELSLDADDIRLSGSGQVRRIDSATSFACDLELSVTGSKLLQTSAAMWLNFEGSLDDVTGSGADGEAVGDFSLDPAISANGAQSGRFDGVGDGVLFPNSGALSFANGIPFSVAVWVRPTSMGPYQTLLAKGPASGLAGSLRTPAMYLNAGQVVFSYVGGEAVFGNVIPIGEWSHVGVVYDGAAKHTIYVNGVEASINPSMPAGNEVSGLEAWTLSLGFSFGSFPLDYSGNLDDLVYWPRELTSAQMQAVFASGPSGV